MLSSAEIRWVHTRWPDLTTYELGKLAGRQAAHVISALASRSFLEAPGRPRSLPDAIVEGMPVEEVRMVLKRMGSPNAGTVRVEITHALRLAADRKGMSPHEFVAFCVRQGIEWAKV